MHELQGPADNRLVERGKPARGIGRELRGIVTAFGCCLVGRDARRNFIGGGASACLTY